MANNRFSYIGFAFFLNLINLCATPVNQLNIDSLKLEIISMESDTQKVLALLDISNFYYEKNTKESIIYAQKALEISEKSNDYKGIVKSNYLLSKIYRLSYIDIAQEYLLEAYKVAYEYEITEMFGTLNNMFGVLKQLLNENEQAITYFNKAMEYYIETDFKVGLAALHNNIGNSHLALGDTIYGIKELEKAIALNDELENFSFLAKNHLNLAMVYLNRNDFSNALMHINAVKTVIDEAGLVSLKGPYYIELSEYHLKKKNYKLSIENAEMGLKSATQENNFTTIKSAYKLLITANYKNQNLEKVYVYSNKLREVQDTIYKFQNVNKLELFEIQLEHEQEKKLNTLTYKNKLLKRNITIFSLIVILMITGFIINTLRLQNNKKREINKSIEKEKEHLKIQLENKERELSLKMIHIANKNELISKVGQKLSSSDLNFKKSNLPLINEILEELKLHTKINIWDSFEKEFLNLHPFFYKNLANKFPNLTQKERRLCAFIKLNMTTKEISDILHIEVKSIETARTRLRNKLNLTGTEINLNSFLENFH